jgi:hypothetical protein
LNWKIASASYDRDWHCEGKSNFQSDQDAFARRWPRWMIASAPADVDRVSSQRERVKELSLISGLTSDDPRARHADRDKMESPRGRFNYGAFNNDFAPYRSSRRAERSSLGGLI